MIYRCVYIHLKNVPIKQKGIVVLYEWTISPLHEILVIFNNDLVLIQVKEAMLFHLFLSKAVLLFGPCNTNI